MNHFSRYFVQLVFLVLMSALVPLFGCPIQNRGIEILIVNDTDNTIVEFQYLTDAIEVFELDEPVPPRTAKYVHVPLSAQGVNYISFVWDNNGSWTIQHPTFMLNVGGRDVIYMGCDIAWVKLTE